MTVARAIALLAGAAFFGRILARPFVEDLYWQQWLGETILRTHALPSHLGAEAFTASGAPYVAQEWLFSLLYAAALHGGIDSAVLVLAALAGTVALWICVRRMERVNASAGAQVLVVSVLALVMITYMAVRVQIVVWPLFALLLACTESVPSGVATRRLAWWSVPITVLWANLHASAAIAPAVLALDSLSLLVAGYVRACAHRIVACIVAGIALVLTPLGLALPLYALSLASSPIRGYISEWRILYLTDYVQWSSIVVLAGFAAFTVRTWRARPIEAGRAIVFTMLAFSAVRYVPLFTMAIAPLAASGATAILAWYREQRPRGVRLPERLPTWSVGLVVLVAAMVFVSVYRYVPATTPRDPRPAMAALAREGRMHRLYCDDFAWCSLGLVSPNFAVFLDGRADPFPVRVWDEWSAIRWTTPTWRTLLDRYRVDTVLTRSNSKLNAALVHESSWRRVAVPGSLVVWERSPQQRSNRASAPLGGSK